MERFIAHYIEDHRRLLASIDTVEMERVIAAVGKVRDQGGQIFAVGNGGSASTASHFVNDLAKGASLGSGKRFKVISLTDNVEWITALGNDLCFEDIFVEQLRNFAAPGDILIALSGSGNSENVLRAVRYANQVGCTTVGFIGFAGGALKELVDHAIVIDSEHMGRIEEMHVVLQHMICYYFTERE